MSKFTHIVDADATGVYDKEREDCRKFALGLVQGIRFMPCKAVVHLFEAQGTGYTPIKREASQDEEEAHEQYPAEPTLRAFARVGEG